MTQFVMSFQVPFGRASASWCIKNDGIANGETRNAGTYSRFFSPTRLAQPP